MLTLELVPDLAAPEPSSEPGVFERRIAQFFGIADRSRAGDRWLLDAVRWAWRTRILLHIDTDLRLRLWQAAEEEAVRVFAGNLRDLLLAAPAGPRPTMGLDPGFRTGVKVAVVDGTGKVVATTPTTATVQLATDAGTTVGIRMASDGQIGALSGTADDFSGTAPLKLTLFSANAALKPGQELVTFGSVGGRPYVPGIPIGRVSRVTTEPGSLTPTALVTPFADFTGLGVLGVVVSK